MADERDDYSGDSFLEDEHESSKIHTESIGHVLIQSPPFVEFEDEGNKESFVSAVDNFAEVSFPPGKDDDDDHEDASGVVVTCMSTIEEESKSCYESSTAPSMSHSHRRVVEERQEQLASSEPVDILKYAADIGQQQDLDVSLELREFQQLVNTTEAELSGNHPNLSTHSSGEENLNTNSISKSSHNTRSNVDQESQDLVNVFMKLEQLQNTQDNILEQVLNADFTVDADELNALISQIPLGDTRLKNLLEGGYEDLSERSVSAEIASIQKIIDGGGSALEIIDNSQKSEVAGGNNLLHSDHVEPGMIGPTSSYRDRDVDDVLREYEDLERSLSSASVVDESFRSDISSVPPLSTYSISKNQQVLQGSVSVPVIKPPVLKTVVPPPTPTPPSKGTTKEYQPSGINQNPTIASLNHHHSSYSITKDSSSYRTKPMASSSNKVADLKPKSSRVEISQQQSTMKPNLISHSARSNSGQSSRNNTQDAYKPRNRRMRSPRTIVSPSPGQPASYAPPQDREVQRNNMTGAGESYPNEEHIMTNAVPNPNPPHPRHITERTDYAVAEALKTIQKLNTMVERQETLLEAYSKDNDKLWTQLKDAKTESLEKESNFQDVINSLRTEVATMKLNRLVVVSSTPSKTNTNTQTQGGILSPSPSVHNNKAETERLREDVELKSQQLSELRKEVLLLQTKLSEVYNASNNAQKQSKPVVQKPPAAGGASALVFHEKEKEYQKELTGLKKQVRTLQKILYSKEPTAPPVHQQTTTVGNRTTFKPLQRTRSDISRQNLNANSHQNALIKSIRNTGVNINSVFPRRPGSSPIKGVNINTSEIIQASFSCMDKEREEFEKIIEDKNKLILEKERSILNLKDQVETLKGQIPEGDVVEPGLVDELRSRIITQNKAIQTLKEHLSTFKKLEAENLLMREDRNLLEHQVQELRRKLEFAQHLVKPENEVLCLLSEKVDELNSRYHHRERQLDTLLSKLTLKTTTGGGGGVTSSSSNCSSSSGLITANLSPRRMPLDQFGNNNGSLGGPLTIGKTRSSSAYISADILHMGDFSPSNSFHLFNSVSDLPDM